MLMIYLFYCDLEVICLERICLYRHDGNELQQYGDHLLLPGHELSLHLPIHQLSQYIYLECFACMKFHPIPK